MAEAKTKATNASVKQFLNAVEDKQRRADCKIVARLMRAATGNVAKLWGASMVGYGSYDFKYESGREGSWFLCGFSPRAQSLTLYIMPGFSAFDSLMNKLGKYKTGKSCLYIKNLDDVDLAVLKQLIDESVKHMRSKYER
jgi:hypothetical protein